MNRFVVLLLVLLVCVVAVGFYRGWFSFSRQSPDAASPKVDVTLTVDPEKVKADVETVKDKTAELTGQSKGATSAPEDQGEFPVQSVHE